MNTRSIFSLILAVALLALVIGCAKQGSAPAEERPSGESGTVGERGVDPLELAADREIVPAVQPHSGDITGHDALVVRDNTNQSADSGSFATPAPTGAIDSLNSQAYRVQVYTGKLFSDARKEVAIAEEIFDQPVYLDYEVPYFKVRVGDFADRDAAEIYRQQAQGAGYGNAWVVLVNLNVREAAPLYEGLPLRPIDSTGVVPPQVDEPLDPGEGPPEE
ncbi:SPOR domain-containing protein [bacterium]|nr:SPOR domain-containing protein [bacterium]